MALLAECPRPSLPLINGLFERAVEDEQMKGFMKQIYNANPFPYKYF